MTLMRFYRNLTYFENNIENNIIRIPKGDDNPDSFLENKQIVMIEM